uniref:Uncharacterized protein n=1 Tax=Spongospora subterranea TaxID=70186 RepID=A0A0H5R2V6_9EUKA|eukprot:CRZ08500.1 hypothetical protein [Spongospora subterranea]
MASISTISAQIVFPAACSFRLIQSRAGGGSERINYHGVGPITNLRAALRLCVHMTSTLLGAFKQAIAAFEGRHDYTGQVGWLRARQQQIFDILVEAFSELEILVLIFLSSLCSSFTCTLFSTIFSVYVQLFSTTSLSSLPSSPILQHQ